MNAGKQTLIGCLILAVYIARAAVAEAPASGWQCPHWANCNDDNEPYRPSKHGECNAFSARAVVTNWVWKAAF